MIIPYRNMLSRTVVSLSGLSTYQTSYPFTFARSSHHATLAARFCWRVSFPYGPLGQYGLNYAPPPGTRPWASYGGIWGKVARAPRNATRANVGERGGCFGVGSPALFTPGTVITVAETRRVKGGSIYYQSETFWAVFDRFGRGPRSAKKPRKQGIPRVLWAFPASASKFP